MKPASPSKKKLLITGISGFTGQHLEAYFTKEGFEVYGTTRHISGRPGHFVCDLEEQDQVDSVIKEIAPDYLIHTAGISFVMREDKASIYRANVLGTENLLQALLSNGIEPEKSILASSATVYGDQHTGVLVESMCPAPVNHYGCSKLAMEHIAANFYDRLKLLIVRPFNYTGPGQAEHFLIPKIIKAYRKGDSAIELGNLDVSREFNDVRDVCRVYHKLLLGDSASEVVNLCSGRAIALMDIIGMMDRISGREMKVKVNPAFVRKNEIKSLCGDTGKLTEMAGEQMNTDIYETLEWMYHYGEEGERK